MDVESLIASVYKHPAVWDKRQKEHANRNIVNRAWKDISEELKHNETALKNKWKSLRDYFTTEYNSRPVARSGDAASNQPQSKWQFFNQLLFLKDIVVPRTSFDSLDLDDSADGQQSATDAPLSATTVAIEGNNLAGSGRLDTFTNPAPLEVPNTEPSPELSPGCSWSTPSANKAREVPTRKRKRDSVNGLSELMAIEERKLQYLSDRKESGELNNDADFLFLKSLLPYMKMVPQHMKLSARNRIQSVLEEFVSQPSAQPSGIDPSYSHHNLDRQFHDRSTPTLSYCSYSTASTPHSVESYTTETDPPHYKY